MIVVLTMIREIKRPLKELRNEFWAVPAEPIDPDYIQEYGPCNSRNELENQLPKGKWFILTRIAEVEVT